MEKPIIFFTGKPGSGKGTQAKLLSELTGWPVFGTSGGLRDLMSSGGVVAHKLKESMDAGILTPYWIASFVYLKALFNIPEGGSLIFDGTSRTPPEAEIVAESLTWLERPFHIFYLEVPDEEVQKRLSLRKEKEARKDDHVVGKRLQEYYAKTDKAIEIYRKTGMLTELDGHRPPDVIAAEIRKILNL